MADLNKLSDEEIIRQLDFSHSDLEKNYKLLSSNAGDSTEIKIINWLIPDFKHVLYGGIYTILRFANYFQANKDIQIE